MRFPKELFVKIEKDGTTEYFVADAKAYALVEMGETITLAKYQLVETSKAQGVASFDKPRRAKG